MGCVFWFEHYNIHLQMKAVNGIIFDVKHVGLLFLAI